MALEGYLAEGEMVLASCDVKGGTLCATGQRLCYISSSPGPRGFRDLLYHEVGAIALGREGAYDLRGWGITLLVVGILVTLIFLGLAILAGWILGLMVAITGLVLIGSFFLIRKTYLTFSGQLLLKRQSLARKWRFQVGNPEQARALIQTVRDKLQ